MVYEPYKVKKYICLTERHIRKNVSLLYRKNIKIINNRVVQSLENKLASRMKLKVWQNRLNISKIAFIY